MDPVNIEHHRAALACVRRRDVTGVSFSFRCNKNGEKRGVGEDGERVRTLTDILVPEVSIVTFPAHPETTAIVRSRKITTQRRSTMNLREKVGERAKIFQRIREL
jgi:phage head maturation protease